MRRLSQKIYGLDSFKNQLNSVLIDSVSSTFANLRKEHDVVALQNSIDWNNLLSCASVLYQSTDFEHLDSALRIAQHCINLTTSSDAQKIAAVSILEGLTNKPAIHLAIKRELVESTYMEKIPLPLKMEMLKRDFDNSIVGKDSSIVFLNRFQKDVYDQYQTSDFLSISAPTSAGKSYILERIILDEISFNKVPKNIVFIVPTRALINQVEQEIRLMLSANKIDNVFLSTVPQSPDATVQNFNKIFVFTQERLHWFRMELPTFKIDLLIVDEAHKIEDGNRGILLQQKIEDLTNDFPDTRIFFSSPFTSNPEFLLEDLPNSRSKAPIKTEFVSVNQNLIYVSQKRSKPLLWEVRLWTKEQTIKLGEITLKNRPTHEPKRIVFVACELADPNGGNIIYANGAAEAEKEAKILADALPDAYSQISSEVKQLIELCKKVVHKNYSLAKVLEKKVAFHYGNMPIIIRQEIERLFKKGDIHYIICTSTLLEGVNLPAKSIFIRKPTRGRGNPLNNSDFWNLAGRAGRWGKEFQGNVICVEPEGWDNKPSIDRSKQEIKKAVDNLYARKDDLIKFIKDKTPRNVANRNLDLEYGFAYFYIRFLKGQLRSDNELTIELTDLFNEIKSSIDIPDEIIIRNPGISPLAQQEVLNYLENYEGDIEELIPTFPESENAVEDSYQSIVRKINSYLSGDPIELAFYQSILIVNWMKGYPLPVLIDGSYNYWVRRGQPRTYDKVIRDVMKDVEEFARFKFAKYSSCYVDLLRHYLRKSNKTHLLSSIPDLHIWLEFGVSQQTQISLIGLGLSRNTAITVSELIAKDSLNRTECIAWLEKNDISSLDISPIMIQEIKSIIKFDKQI